MQGGARRGRLRALPGEARRHADARAVRPRAPAGHRSVGRDGRRTLLMWRGARRVGRLALRAVEPGALPRAPLLGFAHARAPPSARRLYQSQGTLYLLRAGPGAHAHRQLAEETLLRRLIRLTRRAPRKADVPRGRARGQRRGQGPRRPRTRRASACSSAASPCGCSSPSCVCCGVGLIANRRPGHTHAENLAEEGRGGSPSG